MPWIIISMLAIAFLFSYWGWKWERGMKRPLAASWPFVSVIIPSYNSPLLEEVVESAKNLDYPKKEIIVVNDSSEEVSFPGVSVINNKVRKGKAHALNQAAAIAKGNLLFYLDSDTVAAPDCLKKLVPWFSEGVAAVSPKFTVKNKKNILTRLISLEHAFQTANFKIHMHFGSLLSFRGCAIAIRKDVLQELGGWKNTMIEDTDLAATMVKSGYKIMYDPEAVISTQEPDSWKEYRQQRFRWGKGTGQSFFHHHKFYVRNIQFMLYTFPYLLLFLAIIGFFFYQTTIYLLPLASLYLIYTLSIKELLGILLIFIIPLAGNIATSTTVGTISHFAIITNSERNSVKDLALILPYVFFYFPFTMAIYLKGIFSAASDKRKGRPEVDFDSWSTGCTEA